MATNKSAVGEAISEVAQQEGGTTKGKVVEPEPEPEPEPGISSAVGFGSLL